MGSKVSNSLMKLTMVEFSYYIGFPVLQIAEREYHKIGSLENPAVYFRIANVILMGFFCPEAFHYPELNTSHLLRSSWVKTGNMVPVSGPACK